MFIEINFKKITACTLGVFYWTLLNMPPQHRSSLRNIYLLAVVNANHLKLYGFNKVMKQPVEDLKKLATEV